MKKAFSLLELIIVLSIIGVLLLIGYVGFSNYRTTVQLQNAYTDLTTGLKNLQNKANNSSSITVTTPSTLRVAPDFFAYRFFNNIHQPVYCTVPSGSTLVSCLNDDSEYFNNLSNTSSVNVSLTCDNGINGGLGYQRLSGDLVVFNSTAFSGTGQYSTDGTCQLILVHQLSNSQRIINIDLTKNSINL